MGIRKFLVAAASAAAIAMLLGGCTTAAAAPADGRIVAIGAENQYTSVIKQIGGRYVTASSIMSNPNTDPHTFEASSSVAARVSSAQIIVQNGLGYDSFMSKIEAASPGAGRVVISAQKVLELPNSTRNPHLWYDLRTMPAVASRIASTLTKMQPSHAQYFADNLATFRASVAAVSADATTFEKTHPKTTVATTEPVANYLLDAIGAQNLTPWAFQAAIMNDTDPAPQDVAKQEQLFAGHKVAVFVYNRQVTDDITATYLGLARQNHIPVVGVYETMPTNGYTYQSWMKAELSALDKAVTSGKSTSEL